MQSLDFNKRIATKIIVISSVLPLPTSAGQIILHRHLSQLEQENVSICPLPDKVNHPSWIMKLLARLERTRWHRLGNDLGVLLNGGDWNRTINLSISNTTSSLVLTVAHGDGCWAALRFARRHRLPLVTIFHDWWPDIPALHSPLKKIIERRFQHLYQQSDLALCVSEGMRQHLGSHANSHVLYPIPAQLPESIATQTQPTLDLARPLRLLYSGELYEYGPMLGELLQVTKDHSQIFVQVRGYRPNWPQSLREEMRERGLWLDFAPRDELNDWLISADAYLVTMTFNATLRRRMQTSFPSKLAEYTQFGKPLVVWGPEYCSAVQWAKDGDLALCVTDPSPQAVVKTLENLRQHPDKIRHYTTQARQAAEQMFNPIRLQSQFMAAIDEIDKTRKKS